MTPSSAVLVVAGPTAVGKTSFAVALAERIGGEIIGADSRQVYRGMDIGTGKPGPRERGRVAHHLIDVAGPDEPFSAARFAAKAAEIIGELDARGRRPVVVGGTGLYIRALREGLFQLPPRDEAVRSRLRDRAAAEGAPALHADLARVDPAAAARIHPNDAVRIVRALEVFEETGMPITRLQREGTLPPLGERPFVGFLLTRSAGELDRLIRERVEAMLRAGWVEEVRSLLAAGVGPGSPGMESLGYATLARTVSGEIGLAEAAEAIVRETRRYAKRQMTWFRAQRWMETIDLTGRDAAAAGVDAVSTVEGAR